MTPWILAIAACVTSPSDDDVKGTSTSDADADTDADADSDADTDADTDADADSDADTDSDTDTDTGTSDACPVDVAPFTILACAETTASLDDPGDTGLSGGGPLQVDVRGSGLVTEVGTGLGAVPGSAPAPGMQACGAAHPYQVRVVDDEGQTWTFGWDLPGAEASTASILPGSDLDFTLLWQFGGYSYSGALLLSDEVGPLFLFELEPVLSDEDRGGVSVDVDTTDSCIVSGPAGDPYEEHYTVTFGWNGGEVSLKSGQSALLPLPQRGLELSLGRSSWLIGCADGCGANSWAGWAEEP